MRPRGRLAARGLRRAAAADAARRARTPAAVGPRGAAVLTARRSGRRARSGATAPGRRMAASAAPMCASSTTRGVDTASVLRRDRGRHGVGGFDERFGAGRSTSTRALAVALWQAGLDLPRASSPWPCACIARAAIVDDARGPRRRHAFRRFLVARNRDRYRAVVRRLSWHAGAALRRGRSRPRRRARGRSPIALARSARPMSSAAPGREAAHPLHGPLSRHASADLGAAAPGCATRVEDELLAVAQSTCSSGPSPTEAADLHRRHAALHDELDRAHREYARARGKRRAALARARGGILAGGRGR